MKDSSITNFGLLIAYILPGVTTLWGLSDLVPDIADWLGTRPEDAPTIGGFLYITLVSVLAGLTVSTLRWILIDTLHHFTGVSRPNLDFSRFEQSVTAYDTLIEIHYRYYQFYANMVVALTIVWAARYLSASLATGEWNAAAIIFPALILLFWAGSRDTLRKYYARTGQLLGPGTNGRKAIKHRRQNHPPARHPSRGD